MRTPVNTFEFQDTLLQNIAKDFDVGRLYPPFCSASFFVLAKLGKIPFSFNLVVDETVVKGFQGPELVAHIAENAAFLTHEPDEFLIRMSGSALLHLLPRHLGLMVHLPTGLTYQLRSRFVSQMMDMEHPVLEGLQFENSLWGDFCKARRARNLGMVLPRFLSSCFYVAGGFDKETSAEPGLMVQRSPKDGRSVVLIAQSPYAITAKHGQVLLRRTGFDLLTKANPTLDFLLVCQPEGATATSPVGQFPVEYLQAKEVGWMRQCLHNHQYRIAPHIRWSGHEPLRSAPSGLAGPF